MVVVVIAAWMLAVQTAGAPPAGADMSPIRQITRTGESYDPQVAADAGKIHVVYAEAEIPNGSTQLRYRRSLDGGATWSRIKRLSPNSADTLGHAVAAFGDVVHVVWIDDRLSPGAYEGQVYYRRSTDGGATWSKAQRLSFASCGTYGPCRARRVQLAVAGNQVHIVWQDSPLYRVHHRHSLDGGATWSARTEVDDLWVTAYVEGFAASSQVLALVWDDGTARALHFTRSTDNGGTWTASEEIAARIADHGFLAARGNRVDFVWSNQQPGNPEIYWKTSRDGGVTWGAERRVTRNDTASWCPEIIHQGGALKLTHLTWHNYGPGDWNPQDSDIFYQVRFKVLGIPYRLTTRVSKWNAVSVSCPSMTVDGDSVHFVWSDKRTGSHEVNFRSYNPDTPIP
jgi:hypothetical protein